MSATTTAASASSAIASASASQALASLSSVMASASAAMASESAVESGEATTPSYFKWVGVLLAILSGVLIGSSFVFKKKGLLSAQKKYSTTAGEGMQYLKSPLWWTGMLIMIIGEVFNFVAYAFAPAILVTPFGALSVVLCAVLSSIFLKEKLTLFGKIGCFLCVIGSVIIALNGPAGHDTGSIRAFQSLFLSVGFLVWTGISIVASLVLIFWAAPRYGKKYMMVYVMICSLLGGLSVSTTSGLGGAILLSIRGEVQVTYWFFWVLFVFVVITLVSEIIFLNKALELFNTALVTPAYFVTFTSCSIISTIILFKGLDAAVTSIVTLVMGFLVICVGIVLLQLSKVDPEVLEEEQPTGLDRRTTLLMRVSRSSTHGPPGATNSRGEKCASTALEDPGIDTMRGVGGVIGSIVRARSSRQFRASADEYARFDEHGMHRLNTGHHNGSVQRYELSDNSGREESAGNGFLSPLSAERGRFSAPKRGASVVSFTKESLGPHGHHQAQQSRPTTTLSTSGSTSRQLNDIREKSPNLEGEEEDGFTIRAIPSPQLNTSPERIKRQGYVDPFNAATQHKHNKSSSSNFSGMKGLGFSAYTTPYGGIDDMQSTFDPDSKDHVLTLTQSSASLASTPMQEDNWDSNDRSSGSGSRYAIRQHNPQDSLDSSRSASPVKSSSPPRQRTDRHYPGGSSSGGGPRGLSRIGRGPARKPVPAAEDEEAEEEEGLLSPMLAQLYGHSKSSSRGQNGDVGEESIRRGSTTPGGGSPALDQEQGDVEAQRRRRRKDDETGGGDHKKWFF